MTEIILNYYYLVIKTPNFTDPNAVCILILPIH